MTRRHLRTLPNCIVRVSKCPTPIEARVACGAAALPTLRYAEEFFSKPPSFGRAAGELDCGPVLAGPVFFRPTPATDRHGRTRAELTRRRLLVRPASPFAYRAVLSDLDLRRADGRGG